MALPTFTEPDLGQSQSWLDQMNRGLASRGIADGVQAAIDRAVQKIADYTARYELARVRWQRLMQALAVADIYRLIGNVQPAAETAAKEANDELASILAGKFRDLPAAESPVQAITPEYGAWGSDRRVAMRPCQSSRTTKH